MAKCTKKGIYLVEPRKIHPKMMTQAFVRYRAFNGKSSLGCTLAKNLEAGNPPSLGKLQYAWKEVFPDKRVRLPCKCIGHAAACRHDACSRKEETDERETGDREIGSAHGRSNTKR